MDPVLARRLEADKEFSGKITKLVKDYATHGFNAVANWSGEFDVAMDMINCYAPMTSKDFSALEKGHPKRFVLPMTATQITTMTTFVAQMLFGSDQPHKVEGRGPEDEMAAEHLNTLLKWNAEQQPMYLTGYLWVQDALTFNRGVMYNSWKPIIRPGVEMVQRDDPGETDETGQPVKYWTTRVRNTVVGGYAAAELVNPYDWCCDPGVPLIKMQQARFCGHKFRLPVVELMRRSKLDITDPDYVMPSAVKILEEKKSTPNPSQTPLLTGVGGTGKGSTDSTMSRTAYERQQTSSPLQMDSGSKEDKGLANCIELWVRLVPKDYDIHEGDEPVIWQFIVCDNVVLAANESTYAHGMYPYSVGEGRPSGHYQFSPSWVMMLYGLQKHVDYLKNRHQEALQRTTGNIFVADPSKVDMEEFLDPDKEGQFIPLKPAASGARINDIIQQIPIKDLTEGFQDEMQSFVRYADTVTGANNFMQGSAAEAAGSATEFAGAQQMAAGRLSNTARLLSVQGLVPQTRQFVTMQQQFMEAPQRLRYSPDPVSSPVQMLQQSFVEVSPDTIQGEFDFIAHDGTLPGTDSKKVAAITRLLESAVAFPQVFAPAPGNLDPRQLIFAGAKASGVDPERFKYTDQTIANGIQGGVSAQTGVVPNVGGVPPMGAPTQAPGPTPALPAMPAPLQIEPPSVEPPQVRPGSV